MLQLKMQTKKMKTQLLILLIQLLVFVDDQLNLEDQFKYKSNVIERNFNITKQLQQRPDNILETMIKNNPFPMEDLM